MNIAAPAVRNAITTTMIYLMVVGFGLFSLGRLQLDMYPDVSFPTVIILTEYTGASPEDIETLVTRPIEGAASSVKGIKEVRSTSKSGTSVVEARFEWGQDMEQAETDVRRKLEMIESLLPEDLKKSMVFAFDPALAPIVVLTVSGPYPLDELRRIAERDIEPRLVRLPGVASAEVDGGLEREIRVELDPVKVAAFDLDVNQIIAAVYRENLQVPGGSMQQGDLDFSIQIKGKYQRVEDIGEVVIGAKTAPTGTVPVRLKEVARVLDTYFEAQRILEVDGVPNVVMAVNKQSGANTVLAARAVIEALPTIRRSTAADIDFKIIFNQADYINAALGNLSSTGMLGVGITFLVLLFFLRHVRSSLIVAASIPVSVITTFAVMDQAHMTLNILTMAGLALAIGMLVDNAIVVLENIFRLREEGKDPWTAAIEGTRTVWIAVSGSTFTTIVVFVPVLFVPGIAGVLFKDMSVTICFSLVISLVVALTLIPLAASRMLGSKRGASEVGRTATRGRTFQRLYDWHNGALRWVLKRRWVVALALVSMLAITGALAAIIPTEFMAQDDASNVELQVETPVGSNLGETHRAVTEVVRRIEQLIRPEERRLISVDVGIGKGFVALFSKGVHAGAIQVPLVAPEKRRRSQAQIEAQLRSELGNLAGIKVTVGPQFNPLGGAGDIEVQLRGHDLGVARTVGIDLQTQFRALPEMAEVSFSLEEQKPEARVRFDRQKLAELGLSAAATGNATNAYFMGKLAGRYAEEGDEFDILVRYAKEHRLDLDELRKMPLLTPGGSVVPLGNVASVEIGLGPTDITRLDQGRVTRLTLKLKDAYEAADGSQARKDLGRSIARVDEVLKAYAWPKDFSYTIAGSAEDFMTSFRYLGWALVTSMFLVYMVMASQFESLREPFIIMFTVPLAAVGVLLTFLATRSNIDIPALIGLIMLVGIVVNNGIVMVDFGNQLRAEGHDRFEAIVRAAQIRMRPIMMTSATTILGMLPLALGIGEGSAGWAGLAKAVMGGLTFATFLTLFVIPTMYTVFAPKVFRGTEQL